MMDNQLHETFIWRKGWGGAVKLSTDFFFKDAAQSLWSEKQPLASNAFYIKETFPGKMVMNLIISSSLCINLIQSK